MFQRIVERMTKELTDTFHDDHSSRRRRGTLVREKKAHRSVARGARDCTREKANLHLEFYQRTPLMNAVTLALLVDVMSKSFQEVSKLR